MAKIKKAKAQEPFSMHTYIGESASAVKASLHFFKTYPISILPLMLCWVVYASIILYFKYGFNFEGYSAGAIFLMAFGVYVLFSLIYGLACLILLEMAQQVSQDEKVSLGRAVKDAIVRDLLKSVPILLVWAVVWFVLVILQVLFSKRVKTQPRKS